MNPGNDDKPEVGLSFVDLLYAVPVVDLATRVASTHLERVRASGWTDVALALAAITFGWVGHHTNRQQLPPALKDVRNSEQPFTQLRFAQFLVEILIIVAYFALGTRALLPDHQGVGSPDEFGKGVCLVGIYLLYLMWDFLDIRIAGQKGLYKWKDRAKHGMWVTLAFLVVFAVFLVVGLTQRNHTLHSVVVFDLAAIACLYLYRAIQEKCVARA